MYSADEKMIGQWIDGKPLYSKTIQSVIPTAGSDTTVSLSSLGIDSLVNLESSISVFNTMPVIDGYMAEPSSSLITRVQVFIGSAGTLYVRNIGYTAEAGKTIYVTLKYTKTTDSPISIGNDTDYSTDEKIIGTWIDGSPVYQKVLRPASNISLTSPTNLHEVSSLNIKELITAELHRYPNDGAVPAYLDKDGNYIRLLQSAIGTYYTNGFLVLRYTKTS